jgi:hypothetical protein
MDHFDNGIEKPSFLSTMPNDPDSFSQLGCLDYHVQVMFCDYLGSAVCTWSRPGPI